MTTSLPRWLSSVATPALHLTRSEPLTCSVSNSVTRFLCSSATQHPQSHQENLVKDQPQQAPQGSLHDETKRSQEEDDDDDVNKETGEIGGPKGPEPTRYGDWERKGRCYDF